VAEVAPALGKKPGVFPHGSPIAATDMRFRLRESPAIYCFQAQDS